MSPEFFVAMVRNKSHLFNCAKDFKEYLLKSVTSGYHFMYYGDKKEEEKAREEMSLKIDKLLEEFKDVLPDGLKGAS